MRQPKPAARFEINASAVGGPAPRVGEHSRAVLREIGYSEAAVERMIADKAVRAAAGRLMDINAIDRNNVQLREVRYVETKACVLLIGAGDGIGAAVARRFAEGGYKVCIARRDKDEIGSAGEEMTGKVFPPSARTHVMKQCPATVCDVENNVGPIEVCLFNAGSNVNKPLLETTERFFFKAWELACYAGFLVGREAARYMVGMVAGRSFLPARRRVSAAAKALLLFPRPSSVYGLSRKQWPASSAQKIFTSRICCWMRPLTARQFTPPEGRRASRLRRYRRIV